MIKYKNNNKKTENVMRNKKWTVGKYDAKGAERLAQRTGISRLAGLVLCSRGITDDGSIDDFFNDDVSRLHSPFLLEGMDKAAEEIKNAIKTGVKIAVYGDYDVDGMTATCILIKYLRSKGADCVYYIPDRIAEGYGVNATAVEKLKGENVGLLITVDSGITAVKETELAKSLGMKVIITDHHECADVLPDSLAIINPLRHDSKYPFTELAGVGVAFKLICAVEGEENTDKMLEEYGDLVSVGTVADVMSLLGENRVIVKHGLKSIENTGNVGLKALIQESGAVKRKVTTNTISFGIAPRINAAGRLGCTSNAVEMFLTNDEQKAKNFASLLCAQNLERQDTEIKILNEIQEKLKKEFDVQRDKSIVMWGENWHNGVIGIAASKLVDKYNVPVILISLDGNYGKGSGRSINGINLYKVLTAVSDKLERFGGHELAAGLTIARDKLEEFKSAVSKYIEECSVNIDMRPVLEIDCEINPTDVSVKEVEGIYRLEPFGTGNPQPVFSMTDVLIEEIVPVKQDKHLKIIIQKNGCRFTAMLFGRSKVECPVSEEETADIAFNVEINEFRGVKTAQLILRDIRVPQSIRIINERDVALYKCFCSGKLLAKEQLEKLMPSRQEFISVFKYIKQNASDSMMFAECDSLYRMIRKENRCGITLSKMLICLDVFDEFKIFNVRRNDMSAQIQVMDFKGKVNLEASQIIKAIKNGGMSS